MLKGTYGKTPPCMKALLHLRKRLSIRSCCSSRQGPPTKFLENPPLFGFPVFPAPLLQEPVKVLLSLSPSLLYGRYQILFMRVSQVARNIGILQRLEGRKGRGSVQVRDRLSECGCVDVCLGK